MRNMFLVIAAMGSLLLSTTANAQPNGQNDCNPTSKFYCACENFTHGAYYQISYMRLDLKTGQRSVVTALKPYNLNPIFKRYDGSDEGDLKKCRELMVTYPECQ